MKSIVPILCLGILLLPGCIRISVGDSEEGGVLDGKVTVMRNHDGAIPASIQRVYVENQGGPVIVSGVDDNFKWQGELKCHAPDEKTANEFVDRCRIEASENNGAFRIILNLPKGNRLPRVESELRVSVPKNVAVEVQNSFGETEITEIRQTVRVRNQSGRVRLKSIAGEVDAATSFSMLEAEDVGPARLHDQSGALEAARVQGKLVAETSFGSLTVHDVKGTAELINQSGAITADAITGALKARTSFGSLRVQDVGPANLSNQSGDLEAKHVAGDLVAETSFALLSAQDIQGQADLANQSGEITAAEIKGSLRAHTSFARMRLSGHSPTMHAQNQSGAIEISAGSALTTRIEATTTFAGIHLRLPAEAKPLIMAQASFGEVHSDFPVFMKNTLAPDQFAADPATPKVTLRNQSGDIRIEKLSAPAPKAP